MGRIVDGGRRVAPLSQHLEPKSYRSSNRYAIAYFGAKLDTRKVFVRRGGIAGRALLDDMARVREHFGVNGADALRLALHLTAQAIRKNKSLPEV